MGFLKRLITNLSQNAADPGQAPTQFEQLSEEEIEAHLGVARYGDFVLTDAVRPSYDLQVVPSNGYRHDAYRDEQADVRVPVLMASVSRQEVFNVFMDLLDPLGNVVDVVLETSHESKHAGHQDLYREQIDMPVLKSILWEFEELLVNDGCTGIAVLNPHVPLEVQFDEHKLLIVYGEELNAFEKILAFDKLPCHDGMKFITEAEHVHSSSERFIAEFEQLRSRLSLDEF